MANIQTMSTLNNSMPWMKFTQHMYVEKITARCKLCNAQPLDIDIYDDPQHVHAMILNVHANCAAAWADLGNRGGRRARMKDLIATPEEKLRSMKLVHDVIERPKRAIELEDK